MNKEDFKYASPEQYFENKYVYDCEEYLITINEKIFDDETVKYANEIVKKYIENKNEIIDHMLNIDLRDFYEDYSDDFIKENIGRPRFDIISKNNGNKDLKYKYAGVLVFLEHKLDKHIIEIEFVDDLELSSRLTIDG